jgi:hypothetical protein
MKKFMIFLSIFSILAFSCKKENGDKNQSFVFSGITSTNNTGEIISLDTNDWKTIETWTNNENSLFTEKKELWCISTTINYSIIAYPNPCNGIFNLHISMPDEARLAFRIVDKDFKVLVSRDSIFSTSMAINLSDLNISNDIVRIYYKFFGPDCELKGHGDIKIE